MTVRFESLNDIREFVGLASLQPFKVEIHDGERTVNAKSFMEMFTIDFTNPLLVNVKGEDNESTFAGACKKFIL